MFLTIFDLVLILIIFGFIAYGFAVGLVQTIGAVVGVALGAYLAGHWYAPVSTWLTPLVWGNQNLAYILSFVVIFVITSRLVGFIFYLIDKVFHILTIIPFLKSINRLAGAIFGLTEGVLLLSLILYVVTKFSFSPMLTEFVGNSRIAQGLIWVAKIFSPLLPEVLKTIKAVI